ncbi:MAG: NAD(P)/FAD-dependent oxidoreductase [Blastocatellia bacterium]
MKYLIIGGGVTGTTAAEELRKTDVNAEITVISAERHRLYSRVLLPRYVKGTLPREKCFLKKETWYDEQNINCVFETWINGINISESSVSTSDGRTFSYDRLLIATSGNLLKFPTELRGISYLRTIDDADHLTELLAETASLPQESRRAGIVGGSFIAVEYLNFFAQHKIPADLFMLEDTFFGGALDAESFAVLRNRIEAEGIKLHPNKSTTKIIGENRIEGVQCGDETFELSLLGVGIGLRPDLAMFGEAGIDLNRGIITNEFLETNVPNVFAAGDVAEFYDLLAERHVMVGNWLNAQAQGRVVAKTMAGERTAFSAVRAYSTNVCGIEVIFIGDTEPKLADKIIKRGSLEENGVTQIFSRADKVVGATLVNRNADRAELTQLIHKKAPIAAAHSLS